MAVAVEIESLTHRYGARTALDALTLEVAEGQIFGLLGPNGGGKTTLFRILATALPPTSGCARILGHELSRTAEIRRRIGVVFQAPSLDRMLTVRENLVHHGHLYGLSGGELRSRIGEMLDRLRLSDRAGELVDRLSGGLKRRVELAKGLLHRPQVLLMDEPSTGLDPGARRDVWDFLRGLERVTILLTTHLLEEADRCDRLAILNEGRLVAAGTPSELRAEIGGEVVTLKSADPAGLASRVAERFGVEARLVDGAVRIETARGHDLVARVAEAFPGDLESATVGRPTIEDVFIRRTGHRFWEEGA